MTSSLRHKAPLPGGRSASGRSGFTLIEVLVVIGIILVLIGLLLPTINKAYSSSVRNSMAADLQVISQALEAYRNDFGDYPRPQAAESGPQTLCEALISPAPAAQDGNDGPGFRKIVNTNGTSQGKVYGPYLPPDRFKLRAWNGPAAGATLVDPSQITPPFNEGDTVLCDRNGVPILYFVSNPHAQTSSASGGTVATGTYPTDSGTPVLPYLNWQDMPARVSGSSTLVGAGQNSALLQNYLRYALGDANYNGTTENNETLLTSAPFILWSAGPDGVFGPAMSGSTVSSASDDVFNVPLNNPPVGTTLQ